MAASQNCWNDWVVLVAETAEEQIRVVPACFQEIVWTVGRKPDLYLRYQFRSSRSCENPDAASFVAARWQGFHRSFGHRVPVESNDWAE